jgi:ferredoxin
MHKRKIIKIHEAKCNGCGVCIPNCPEGALQVIDGKARLISDLFCDGLGACIGHCPQGAITIEEREAGEYDEKRVMENIVKQGKNVILAHLKHLKDHQQDVLWKEAVDYLKEKGISIPASHGQKGSDTGHFSGCPGSRMMELQKRDVIRESGQPVVRGESQLRQWPIQITLVPVRAPFFQDADVLIAADCVPCAYPQFHEELLKGKILLVGCPKLDDTSIYREKITRIVKENAIKSISYAHMEVPCCFGLIPIIREAIAASGKDIAFREVTISIKGEKLTHE